MRGFAAQLDRALTRYQLWVEYIGMKRFSGADHLRNFRSYLANKYRSNEFDLVVSSDDDALEFLLDYGGGLFGGAPVIFCGINDEELA